MTPMEYVQRKGFEHQVQAGQIVLKSCPFCGDAKGHFYMDQDEGAFFCHKCNESGNLITLQKHYGDFNQERNRMNRPLAKPQGGVRQAFEDKDAPSSITPDEKKATEAHERLLTDQDAVSYITETRGISIETVKAFKIGLKIEGDGGRWLTIPHYEKGKLINIKSRSLPPAKKDFRRVKDCRSILFNGDAIEAHGDEIYITEGEIDALTSIDQGIKNVVGITTGAGSFDPSWIDQLQAIKKIILCYDPDEAGQKGAREVARRLGYDRCFNVVLPDGQDVNDFFTSGHDLFDFQNLVNLARQFDVAGIMSFRDGLEALYRDREQAESAGLRMGFVDVDKLVKTGFNAGELIILSAPPKIGKSTFALQICTHNALQGIPALFFCLEMRPAKIIEKVVKCQSKREKMGDIEIINTQQAFRDKPFYMGFCYQRPTLDGIMDTLKAAVRRYGLKLVVFDHLHFLCRSLSNQIQEVSLAVQAFKFLAEELEIPVILIAQPRKIQADAIMTAQDLKDSSSVFSDCDHLIILHRGRLATDRKQVKEGMETRSQAFDPVTLVRVEASRYNAGGEALFYFHGEYSRFDEIDSRR